MTNAATNAQVLKMLTELAAQKCGEALSQKFIEEMFNLIIGEGLNPLNSSHKELMNQLVLRLASPDSLWQHEDYALLRILSFYNKAPGFEGKARFFMTVSGHEFYKATVVVNGDASSLVVTRLKP